MLERGENIVISRAVSPTKRGTTASLEENLFVVLYETVTRRLVYETEPQVSIGSTRDM